jgi:hypothetical protein
MVTKRQVRQSGQQVTAKQATQAGWQLKARQDYWLVTVGQTN